MSRSARRWLDVFSQSSGKSIGNVIVHRPLDALPMGVDKFFVSDTIVAVDDSRGYYVS